MTKTTAVATPISSDLAEVVPGQAIIFKDMDQIMKGAELMANAKHMVPAHLIGNPGSCMAIIMQAQRWGMDAFAVAQKTHVVSGNLGYEAQLVNAVVTSMAPTKDRLNFEWFGDWSAVQGKNDKSADKGVRVWATMKGESEPRVLEVTMAQAGVRNSPLWEQDPRQQLAYLAVKRWARLYTPDVLLGVYSADELQDSPSMPERDITPGKPAEQATGSSSLKDKLKEAEEAVVVDETPAENDVPAILYADVAEAINKATTDEEMARAAALAGEFTGQDDCEKFREELTDLYKSRREQLKTIEDEQAQ